MKKIDFFTDTRVVFGAGRLQELGTMKLPGKKALLVISCGKSVHANGSLDKVEKLLGQQGIPYALYDKIIPNPTAKSVDEGSAYAKKEGCDFVIALGGGSTIDASKAIAVMMKNPGVIWDYVTGGSAKGLPIQYGAAPLVAINTTAGTGSEVDLWSVITNEETNEKIGWGADECFAKIAIEDPELTLTIPPALTAYQGFDAFMHLSECYISALTNDFNDMFSLKGIEILAKYLPKAVQCGSDLEARSQVMYANMLAGYCQFISGCVSQHAMEHAMSGVHQNLTHGLGLLLLSEDYFSFFGDKPGYAKRYGKMAEAMGVKDVGASDEEKVQAFLGALRDLRVACGVADLKASDYGMSADEADDLAHLARKIMPDMFTGHDAYHMSEDETASIFRKALAR